jgi:RNA polymerase sigma-70 factor (ECF subfamily)
VKRDIADFTTWYELESGAVTRTLGAALGDLELAEEVAAEAFSRAFARWATVSRMSAPTGWVYRVALNEARSRFRRRTREQRLGRRRERAADVPAPECPDDALWNAVRALPPRSRTAVALRYIADLPEAEIAELLGISRGNVARVLHDARRQIATTLTGVHQEVLS